LIAFVRGEIAQVEADALVVDVNGLGYRVFATPNTIARARQLKGAVKLFTSYQVREDSAQLFGFLTEEERAMFGKLLGVSGIGARSAMAVLSQLTIHELSAAVVTNDIAAIARAPGVGKKTAQRIALELRDKIDNAELTGFSGDAGAPPVAGNAASDAIAALMALGYNSAEATRAVSAAAKEAQGTEDIIRMALKAMDKGR
jgi:Holliday junction DNA helicase RuvA